MGIGVGGELGTGDNGIGESERDVEREYEIGDLGIGLNKLPEDIKPVPNVDPEVGPNAGGTPIGTGNQNTSGHSNLFNSLLPSNHLARVSAASAVTSPSILKLFKRPSFAPTSQSIPASLLLSSIRNSSKLTIFLNVERKSAAPVVDATRADHSKWRTYEAMVALDASVSRRDCRSKGKIER